MSNESFGNPFPGLRAFEASESHLFFGREQHADELFRRLGRQRFVAVVGASGSGKSSLVRAGLLPLLHAGFLNAAAQGWRIACLKPGNRPVERLAEALAALPGFAPDGQDVSTRQAWVEATLRRSSLGLIEAARAARMPEGEALLVVVDQFEELFRNVPEEGSVFVRLLLEAVRRLDGRVFVVITMRSDYLGECALFRDLPETLNDAQYLVPRMTRQQLRRAIESPARVAGREVAPGLVNRLLNELGDDPNRLPVLQHALMCTWSACRARTGESTEVTVADYDSVGGMKAALLRHANGTYERVLPSDRHREIATGVFKALTGLHPRHHEVRRQTTVGELLEITRASREELTTVLEIFLAPGRTFLTRSPSSGPLGDGVEVDIAHESLIRLWDRLATWTSEEAGSAERYERLADRAVLHERGEEDLLRSPQLEVALQWIEKQRPSAAWAERYGRDFDKTIAFVETSRRAHEEQIAQEREARRRAAIREQEERRRRRQADLMQTVSVVSLLVVVVLGILIYNSNRGWRESKRQTAREQLRNALAVADRGDLLRSTHALAAASDGADAEDKWLVAQSVWPYATAIPVDLTIPSRAGEPGAPLLIQGAVHARSDAVARKTTLAWTNDGKLLLWNHQIRAFEREVADHKNVTGAAFSPDGRRALTWSDADGNIRLWTVQVGLSLQRAFVHEGLTGASFSSDGADVITWADGDVRVWSAHGRNDLVLQQAGSTACDRGEVAALLCATIDAQRRTAISWSKRRSTATASSSNATVYGYGAGTGEGEPGDVRVWDLSGSTPVARLLAADVIGARLSPRGTHVVTWTAADVSVWNVGTGSAESVLPVRGLITGVYFDPSGRYVLAFASTTAWLWDTDRPGAPMDIAHDHAIKDAQFLTGDRLITWDSDTAKVWQIERPSNPGARSRQSVRAILEHSALSSIAISADRKTLATWGANGPVKLWDIGRGTPIGEYPKSEPLRRVEFGPTNRTLLMTGRDGRMQLWNIASGVPVFDMSMSRLCTAPLDTASGPFSGPTEPCAYAAALLDDYTMVAWAVPSGVGPSTNEASLINTSQIVSVVPSSTETVAHLRDLAPDALHRRAAIVSDDGRLGLLSVATSTKDLKWLADDSEGYLRGMKISPDGRWAFTWRDPSGAVSTPARLWDLDTARQVGRIDFFNEIAGATFSNDGRWLVTWSNKDTRLWRVPELTSMHTIDGSNGAAPGPEPVAAIGGASLADDRSLIVWTASGEIFTRPIAAGTEQRPNARVERTSFGMRLRGITVSTDGDRIVGWTGGDGSVSARVKVFKRDGWRPAGKELDVKGGVREVVLVGASDRLLTLMDSGAAHLWSNTTGARLADLTQDGPIQNAVMGAQSGLILTSSVDGVGRLWDGQSGLPVSRAMRHRGVILAAHFMPDEDAVVTYSTDGWRHMWDVGADRLFPALGLLARVATGARVDIDTPVPLTQEEWVADKLRLRLAIEEYSGSGECSPRCRSGALLTALAAEPLSGPSRTTAAAKD
jgi:WD40 repeat protein